MIELRPYRDGDGEALLWGLHDISLEELFAAGCAAQRDVLPYLECARERGRVTTCLIDGVLAFVGASICDEKEDKRYTGFFLAARLDERRIGFALRKWSRAERALSPNVVFYCYCYGTHPKRDRFLALAGLTKKSQEKGLALFTT